MSLIDTIDLILNHPLNRKNKFESVVRFAKWQVGSRLIPGQVVFNWVNGSKFFVRTGETGLTGNIYTGLHEFPDMGFLLHFLRPDDLFVDVGANVGSYSILACSAVGASGVAFEPVPSTFQRLSENLNLNHLQGKVQAVNKGVGDKNGVIHFTSKHDTTNHALANGEIGEDSVPVQITTLDSELQGLNPALIKIDVEGFETPVLRGAADTLSKPSLVAVIMELNGSGSRYGFDESGILKTMLDAGFKTYSYDPLGRKLINLNGKNLNSGNTLFLRNLDFVEKRLMASGKVAVNGKVF